MIAVYDKLIYFNEASKYTILRMRTDDPSVPEEARSQYTFRDRMLRFTAVGYGLPQTDSVKLEIEGDWKEGKYGLQLHVEHWHELVPPTTEGLLSYLSSGLLKGIGESTARSIVQRFGTDTLDVLEYHPEKLLEIRGITEQKLEEIKTCYAESRAMRDIMELLTPFQVTPVTAMKIYQHFGPACTDILRRAGDTPVSVPEGEADDVRGCGRASSPRTCRSRSRVWVLRRSRRRRYSSAAAGGK